MFENGEIKPINVQERQTPQVVLLFILHRRETGPLLTR